MEVLNAILLGLLEHLHLIAVVLAKPITNFLQWYFKEEPDVLAFEDCENPWRDFINEHVYQPVPVPVPVSNRVEYRRSHTASEPEFNQYDDLLVVTLPAALYSVYMGESRVSSGPATDPVTITATSW